MAGIALMGFVVVRRERERAFVDAVLVNDVAGSVAREAEIAHRVRSEVARLRAAAEAEGRAAGEAEGRGAAGNEGRGAAGNEGRGAAGNEGRGAAGNEGRGAAGNEGRGAAGNEGRAAKGASPEALAEIASAAAALQAAGAELAAPLRGKERDLADLVIELAFVMGRHIIGAEIAADRSSLRTLVAGLITEAAAEADPTQNIVIRVNPRDLARLDTLALSGNMRLAADAAISRGGAMVEINVADGDPIGRIEWDATVESRIDALRAALALPESLAGGK